MSMSHDGNVRYIAALDVGTTTVRCIIYDSNVQICGSANAEVCMKSREMYVVSNDTYFR